MCEWLALHADHIAKAHAEDALANIFDWLECDLIEDPDSAIITLRGRTSDVPPDDFGWDSDPLWERGNDAIVKRCIVADLESSVKRWRKMARTIDRISIH